MTVLEFIQWVGDRSLWSVAAFIIAAAVTWVLLVVVVEKRMTQ